MNAERLLQHFERISEAPDAVPRLRQLILDLAVRGKLVEQDPADEPATELLKRIDGEKKRFAKAHRSKKAESLPPLEEAEIPFELPPSWTWTQIRTITTDRGQRVPENEFSYIDVSAIDNLRGEIKSPQVLHASEAPSRARKLVEYGDVIYSCVRPYLLNVAVVDHDIEPRPIASTAFAVLYGFGLVSPYYLWIALRSPVFVAWVEEKMRGQAYPAINDRDFASLPVPLPPLAEQLRIVARVSELMALCDELEAAQRKREECRDRLAAATLHNLTHCEANSAVDGCPIFQEGVRFFFSHLPHFTTRPGQVKQLRQTILNLAIRGRLVSQSLNDEPAQDLLRRLVKEKERLDATTKVRRTKPLPLISSGEKAFPVSHGWAWARIGDLAICTNYGTSEKSSADVDCGVPVLTMGDVREGQVDLGGEKRSVPKEINDLPALFLRKLDLLYNRTNSPELVGKTGIYLGEDNQYTFASYLIRIRVAPEYIDPHFLNMAMNTPWFRETQITPRVKKQTGQANVNGTEMRNMIIPLPPFEEQHRIVAKVDKLMALCDELEARITETASSQNQLLEALIHEVVGR